MSKSSLWAYNLYVILIAGVLSFLVFLICGFAILPIVVLVSFIIHSLRPGEFHAGWVHMFKICLIILAIVVGIFNIIAVFKNIQFTKSKI